MYCLLNWSAPDLSDLSLAYDVDGDPLLYETEKVAKEEAELYRGTTVVVDLSQG